MGSQIHLVSFLIHSPINHTVLSWAAEGDNRLQALGEVKLWQDLARTLERGLFDGMFFADTPGVFDRYQGSADAAIRYGVCWPTHDPTVLLSALIAATEKLGFAVTISTGSPHPYSIVRQLSTLDYLSGGRVGWNIVTGHLRGEHRAFGLPELPHDQRYDRADEYMEVCYALWNSIGEGAIIADRKSGIFADPSKVTMVNHEGTYFKCNTVSPTFRSPQGRPVLFQAGSSGRGQQFALQHADVIFAIQPHVEGMKKFVTDLNGAAEAAGKTARVTFGIQPIIGGTEEEAQRKLEDLRERIPLDAALTRLSGTLGVDFSQYDLDKPLEELQTQASQGLMKAMTAMVGGNAAFTLRQAAMRWGLAVGIPQIVGTPEQVAEKLETIWRESGCHGFNVTPTINAESVAEFVDEVVPLLQKRGVYPTEYQGNTFAEHLGL